MSRQQTLGLINSNIKTNSGRVSPNKTTGTMLKEVLVALANSTPESEDYGRSNSTPGLSDYQYIEKFVEDPAEYNYTNIQDTSFLDGDNGNFFMNIFREMALQISNAADQAFDREAKFIVGKQVTNSQLTGTNWFVADGSNTTDDMRGRATIGGGNSIDSNGKSFTIPYVGKGGYITHTLTESDLPEYDPANGIYKHLVAKGSDISSSTDAETGDSANGNSEAAIHRINFTQARANTYGSSTPDPIQLSQPSIYGTWLQYIKPDIQPPSTPTNLREVPDTLTTTQVRIDWTASTDDTGVSEYQIFVDNAYVTSTANTYEIITGLASDTNYQIKVRAVDNFNKLSEFTEEIVVSTPEEDLVPPTTPTILTVDTIPGEYRDVYNVYLTLQGSEDPSGIDYYELERREVGSSMWELLDGNPTPTSQGTLDYTDTNSFFAGAISRDYEYRIRAVDNFGNYSGHSNYEEVTIPRPNFGPDLNHPIHD